MSKEDLGRGELFQGAFKTIGQWSQEKGLLSIQCAGFQLGYSFKTLDLKDDSHHRSSFLPSLGAMSTCLENFAS